MSSGVSKTLISLFTVAATLATVTACAQEVDTNPLEGGVVAGGPPGDDQPETPDNVHDTIEAAVNDIETFWEETYPEVYGGEFEPLEGGYVPYGPDTDPLPCGDPSYDEVADNAFYCPDEDLIAWDEASLMPTLAEEFGPFTVGVVLAHEMGHAIQPRAGVPEDWPTIYYENQADCFAGAWTRWLAEGNSEEFQVTEETLDSALGGIVSFSDAPGTSAADPGAHGLGFDRVSAFQDGWENSAAQCATYVDDPPVPVEIPFTDPDDFETGGNMELEGEGGLLALIQVNLNLYYELLFQDLGADPWVPVDELVIADPSSDEVTCDGETLEGDDLEFISRYCEEENVVVLDGEGLVPELYERIGDFAVGVEIGRLYARAAQLQLGVDGDEEETSLQADCLTGVWAADNFPGESGTSPLAERVGEGEDVGIVLSPGDLDEAIIGFLSYGETLPEDIGTAFDRTTALRAGFLPPGIEACEAEQYGGPLVS